MKLFTSSDISGDAKYCHLSTESTKDLVDCPLPWQLQGLHETACGYGRKLTLPYKINYNGQLYRLYCTQISNAGSVWFISKGVKVFVS
jgi:hypothetical protein